MDDVICEPSLSDLSKSFDNMGLYMQTVSDLGATQDWTLQYFSQSLTPEHTGCPITFYQGVTGKMLGSNTMFYTTN